MEACRLERPAGATWLIVESPGARLQTAREGCRRSRNMEVKSDHGAPYRIGLVDQAEGLVEVVRIPQMLSCARAITEQEVKPA